MKRIFNLTTVIIIILGLLNCYALVNFVATQRKLNNETFFKRQVINDLQYTKDQLKRQKENAIFYIKGNAKPIPFVDSFSIVGSQPVLVLRIHTGDCNNCVKESLYLLKQQEVNKYFKIVVFADYPSLKSVSETFVFDYPVYISPFLDADKLVDHHRPYYFVVSNSNMSNFFIPEYDAMDLFKVYVEQLKMGSS